MTIWYKQGVFGQLQPEAIEGLRQTDKLYAVNKEDVFVTSIQDGTHSPGSFHMVGMAWDQRKGVVSKESHQRFLGQNFQVIDESDHRHVEYDPKK